MSSSKFQLAYPTFFKQRYADTIEPEIVHTVEKESFTLPSSWFPLRPHELQQAFLHSKKRFVVVPAGRRSGKTMISKRRLVRKALQHTREGEAKFVASAPTNQQAKRIFWNDLKRLTPKEFIVGKPNESDLSITLVNDAIIAVMGMDVPERIEGAPIAHWLGDEYGNMKEKVWPEHVRPALMDTGGTADLIGVPEGRNHYYDLWQQAQEEQEDWDYFTWFSSTILPKSEIAAMKQALDERTFRQECEAEFVTFSGVAYYTFSDDNIEGCSFDPTLPLILCFDFNVDPGVCIICQERNEKVFVFDEVYIPEDSNTPRVCTEIKKKYPNATSVICYGDPAGGARHTSQVDGSDWDLIRQFMRASYPKALFKVDEAAPAQRSRLNAMNSKVKSMSGEIGIKIDPKVIWLIKDFQGVKMDGQEIDKSEKKFTHCTDAFGYFIEKKYPVRSRKGTHTLL